MKDLLKNRRFYLALAPTLAAVWPLWVGMLSVPAAKAHWLNERAEYTDAQKLFLEILELDPKRIELVLANPDADKFDYSSEIEKTAGIIGIKAANYKLTVRKTIKVSGQNVQSANLTIENVDITKFTQFLATIQLRWPNLQCTQLTLNKQKVLPDAWKADLKFKYFR